MCVLDNILQNSATADDSECKVFLTTFGIKVFIRYRVLPLLHLKKCKIQNKNFTVAKVYFGVVVGDNSKSVGSALVLLFFFWVLLGLILLFTVK